ncbi:phage replication initiation protein, NGO0469 family [Pontibacter mangrovi]|uniref:Uncharacterized protein n=1 Tax=Pontibacter mangrovi TaxID=2589816 RepID=A0A501W9B6_9BACT|nr:hypothetical protein [Pontibacter mangrovi]TPE44960.1 hypothetical protein FJM65_08060 [Pontibacter mangrovi]
MSQSNQPATTAEFDEFYAPAESSGSSTPPIEAGNYLARCFSMVLLGTFDDEYQGKVSKRTKVRISFELPTEMHVYKEEDGEQPRIISKEYNFSMNEKASMRKDLENWRGKKFTDEEASKFNIAKLLGVPCMLNVIQKVSKSGNTYSVISSISPLPKGFNCPEQVTPSFTFSVKSFNQEKFDSLPDFLKKNIQESDEYKAQFGNAAPAAQAQQAPPAQAKYVPGQGVMPPTPAPAAQPAAPAAAPAPAAQQGAIGWGNPQDTDDLPF